MKMPAKKPSKRPRTRRQPGGDGLAPRKRPAAAASAAEARFALVQAQLRPSAPPTAAAEPFSQAEAWAAEPDWDELTPEEQIAHLEADAAELHRRAQLIRSGGQDTA
jgi:hypothetical protein